MTLSCTDVETVDSLIQILQNNADPQSLLHQSAQTIGISYHLDFCSLVSGTVGPSRIVSWSNSNILGPSSQNIDTLVAKLGLKKRQEQDWPLLVVEEKGIVSTPVSLLIDRLVFRQQVIGFVILGRSEPSTWNEQEISRFNSLESLLAVACSMAMPTLPARSVRQSLLKKWYQETQEQIANKKSLLDLQEQIITTLSDRIRNPLATIKMAVQLLERSSSEQDRYWTILKQACSQIEDLFNSITILRKIQTQELTFNPKEILLQNFISELAEHFQLRWHSNTRRGLSLLLESEPVSLFSDPHHLRSIVNELLINAENFSASQSEIQLKTKRIGDQIVIEISNIGLMITPEEMDYIFDPFQRGVEPLRKSIPGIGIGLTLVKGLVDYLGGKIEVSSQPYQDKNVYLTCFTLSFPQ
ncbi:MAG: HAMP domain-containing sensor histidine kinase [Cyanobacteriota bacterium ELA615]